MGLVVKNVNKSFGDKHVVDNISFELKKPGVFGLLGTNGAGKTTTIRMILGIIKKDSGEITWDGKEVTRGNVNFEYQKCRHVPYKYITTVEQMLSPSFPNSIVLKYVPHKYVADHELLARVPLVVYYIYTIYHEK